MAEQREISISQFFEKNKHLLGYDNKLRALLTIIKEGVDNSLDATEEARILADLYIKIEEVDKEKYKVVIKDNGPGILEKHIPNVFGKLLYGSKFHRYRQSRGQQGLGISGCVLYAQLTTGEPTTIISSVGDGKIHKFKLTIDVNKNEPKIVESSVLESKDKWHGVQVTFLALGQYREHKQSVLEYIKQTAVSNPFANITFDSPTGRYVFARGVDKLPVEPKEILPHLYGIEVGVLGRMLQHTSARSVGTFFTSEFSRVGKTSADEICKIAGVDPKNAPKKVTHEEVITLVKAAEQVKLSRPPTDCLSPLGHELVIQGLKKEAKPEWVDAISRPPEVYRGWPFQIEVGLAYGGDIKEPTVMRMANRVPLLYMAGDCAITKSVQEVDWRRYGLNNEQMKEAPLIIMVHMCSVWVPFTSESKEAIANYPEIMKEIKLALQDAGRKLASYLSGVRKAQALAERKSIFERYAHETAKSLEELTGEEEKQIKTLIAKMVEKRWGEAIEGVVENGEEEVSAEKGSKEEE